jgi:hypothetical protein
MSKQPETIFKEKFREQLDAIPFSWWVKLKLPSVLGIPDILGTIRGRFVALELKKSEAEKPAKIQLYHLDVISQCGGYARVAYPENAAVILDELWKIK